VAAGHTHVTRRLTNAEVALPLLKKDLKKTSNKLDTPNSRAFLEHWLVLRAFNLDMAGPYQLKTIVSPVPFLRKVISDIFTDVFQLLDRLSRRNNPGDTFDEDAYNVVLRLSLLIAPLFFQCTVSQSSLKKRIKYFLERRWTELFADFEECLKTPPSDGSGSWTYTEEGDDFHFDDIMEKLGKKAERHIRNGEMRKALVSLCDPPSYAANSADVFIELQGKHPKRLPQNEIVEEDPVSHGDESEPPEDDVIVITEDILIQAIKDSPKESAPGVDGFRMDHLYQLLDNGQAGWIRPLTNHVNDALAGDLPEWYYYYISGANLIAIAKKPSGVRPISMGSVWRKLMSRCALLFLEVPIALHLSLFQYGVGTRAGCEVVQHRTRDLLARNPSYVVVKTDFKNAFNSIFRKFMLNACKESLPGLYKYVFACYKHKSKLWAKSGGELRDFILSEEGVQQGDVLGPLLFCLLVQPILIKLNAFLEHNSEGEVLGLMDDFTLISTPEGIGKVWPLLVQLSAEVGLELSVEKCQVYCPGGLSEEADAFIPADIIRKQDGIVMLGAPVGTDEYCYSFWNQFLVSVARQTEILCAWSNTQAALTLFRMCVASRLTFIFRNLPPFSEYATKLSSDATALMRNGFAKMIGGDHLGDMEENDYWWLQATLPAIMGGCGIFDPSNIHPIAYLSSEVAVSASISALQAQKGLPAHQFSSTAQRIFAEHVDHDKYPSLEEMAKKPVKMQHALSMDKHKARMEHLKGAGPSVVQRIESCAREGSVLVTCIPKSVTDTVKDGELARGLQRTRLGLSIPYLVPGPCLCNTRGGGCQVDRLGQHLRSDCIEGNLRQCQHNNAADRFCDLICMAGYTAKREQSKEIKAHNQDSKMRIDITVPNYAGNVTLGVEVSIVDVGSAAYSNSRNIMVAGKASADREAHKMEKYREVFAAEGFRCEPLVIEALGRFGDRTREFFNEMCQRAHENTGYPLSYLKNYFRIQIVMGVHITSSAGVRNRMREVMKRRTAKSSPKTRAGQVRSDVDIESYSRARFASPQGK
jgi:hypothetical protein